MQGAPRTGFSVANTGIWSHTQATDVERGKPIARTLEIVWTSTQELTPVVWVSCQFMLSRSYALRLLSKRGFLLLSSEILGVDFLVESNQSPHLTSTSAVSNKASLLVKSKREAAN